MNSCDAGKGSGILIWQLHPDRQTAQQNYHLVNNLWSPVMKRGALPQVHVGIQLIPQRCHCCNKRRICHRTGRGKNNTNTVLNLIWCWFQFISATLVLLVSPGKMRLSQRSGALDILEHPSSAQTREPSPPRVPRGSSVSVRRSSLSLFVIPTCKSNISARPPHIWGSRLLSSWWLKCACV